MMAYHAARREPEVIDLVSDDGDSSSSDGGVQLPPPRQEHQQAPMDDFDFEGLGGLGGFGGDMPGAFPDMPIPGGRSPQENQAHQANQHADGEFLMIDGEEIFIPNSPGSAPRPASTPSQQTSGHDATSNQQNLTADDCLQQVLGVFPDVSHEHVLQLYRDIEPTTQPHSRVESIVNNLVSGDSYPKQDKSKKRKREEEVDEDERKRWEGADRQADPIHLRGVVTHMLKAEFPDATNNLIAEQLRTHRHLYQTYIALAKSRDGNDATGWRGRAPKGRLADADTIAANSGWDPLSDELKAARKQVERIRAEHRAENAKKMAEQENLQRAIEAGETAECQACFEDLPMNRQIHCNGDTAHFTCFDCAETYIKSEVGDSRCRVLCTAGCGAGFAHAQLHQLADKKLLEKLEQLQQEKDLRDAGLDLDECPFCEYKAELPPVEEDFEFRCMNPLCEKVSCRRCKAVSHIPLSCEEVAKDNKLNTRHKIEEAMTAALIRSCNKCKKQFIKEYGCNKMSCPSCGNLQCYVCSESLKGYDHFDQGPGYPGAAANNAARKKCPLYDNVEERHEREVKEAEAAARAQAMSENPDISEKDLEIKVSDGVQKATRDRIQRGAVGPGGIPPPMDGGLFARMPRFGRLWADDADDDEDFEDDDDFFGDFLAPPRRRRNRPNPHDRAARLGELFMGGRHGAEAPARDPRLRHQQINPPAAQVAANPPAPPAANAAPRMHGFIPVFGMHPPAMHAQNAQYPPIPNANPPAGQPLGQAPAVPAPAGLRGPQGLRLEDWREFFGLNDFDDMAGMMAPAAPPAAPPAPQQAAELAAQRQRQQRQIAMLRQQQEQQRLQFRLAQQRQQHQQRWPGGPNAG